MSSHEDEGEGSGCIERKYVRLVVRNEGNSAAKGCRVILEKIEEVTIDSLKPITYRTPLRLLWSKEKTGNQEDTRTISKGEEIVDLFKTENFLGGGRIVVRDIEFSRILEFGKRYRFTIVCRGEEIEEQEIVLDASFGSTWDQIHVKHPNSVVIRGKKKVRGKKNWRPFNASP